MLENWDITEFSLELLQVQLLQLLLCKKGQLKGLFRTHPLNHSHHKQYLSNILGAGLAVCLNTAKQWFEELNFQRIYFFEKVNAVQFELGEGIPSEQRRIPPGPAPAPLSSGVPGGNFLPFWQRVPISPRIIPLYIKICCHILGEIHNI